MPAGFMKLTFSNHSKLGIIIEAYASFYGPLPSNSTERLYGRTMLKEDMIRVGGTIFLSDYEYFLHIDNDNRVDMRDGYITRVDFCVLNTIIRYANMHTILSNMISIKSLSRYREEGGTCIISLALTREQKFEGIRKLYRYLTSINRAIVHLTAENIFVSDGDIYISGEDVAIDDKYIYNGPNWILTCLSSVLLHPFFTYEDCLFILPMFAEYFYSIHKKNALHTSCCTINSRLIPSAYIETDLETYFRARESGSLLLGHIMICELATIIGYRSFLANKDNYSTLETMRFAMLSVDDLIARYSR